MKQLYQPIIIVATIKEYEIARRRFGGNEIVMTGVGGANVIETLKAVNKDRKAINFGYVGSNILPVGTEVRIGKCCLYHPNVEYEEPMYKLGGTIACYTSNDFVLDTDMTEAVVFDMELAYILALGFSHLESIKIVSDNLSLKQYERNIII